MRIKKPMQTANCHKYTVKWNLVSRNGKLEVKVKNIDERSHQKAIVKKPYKEYTWSINNKTKTKTKNQKIKALFKVNGRNIDRNKK